MANHAMPDHSLWWIAVAAMAGLAAGGLVVAATTSPKTSHAVTTRTVPGPTVTATRTLTPSGGRLLLPQPSATKPFDTGTAVPAGLPQLRLAYYTVQPGDTLIDIGMRFNDGGDWLPVWMWSKSVIGRNPDLIFPGQVIIVREDKGRSPDAIQAVSPTPAAS
jgi:nucleoid-associated protein YgaU